MNVAELARELDLPPSRLIDLCSRLGVDATWAGADLSRSDELLLRTRLASEERPAERDHPPRPGSDGRPADPLPPTAAGSIPGLAEDPAPDHPSPGFLFAGDTLGRSEAEVEADRSGPGRGAPRPRSQVRTFDPSLRPALIAVVLGMGSLVASEVLDLAPVAIAGWLLATACFVVALVSSNRARYHITTHPERRRGLPVAVVLMVVSVLGLSGLALGTWTVVRSAPAAQAPLGAGDLRSVKHLRWGYHRLRLIADNGWSRPAKDAGTCWERAGEGDDPRVEHRSEHGYERVSCDSDHDFEVLAVYSIDRDFDSPYPGRERLVVDALARCAEALDRVVDDAPDDLLLVAEVPEREGWERGDHDVTCVSALPRGEPLLE